MCCADIPTVCCWTIGPADVQTETVTLAPLGNRRLLVVYLAGNQSDWCVCPVSARLLFLSHHHVTVRTRHVGMETAMASAAATAPTCW